MDDYINLEILTNILNYNKYKGKGDLRVTSSGRVNNNLVFTYLEMTYKKHNEINIYEFVYLYLKSYSDSLGVLNKLNWSNNPKQIIKGFEVLVHELGVERIS